MAKAKANTNALTPALQKIEKFKKQHKRLFIASLLLIAFLLAWLIWHKQMTDMFDNLLGISNPSKSQTSGSGLEVSKLNTIDAGTGSSGGGGQTGGTGGTGSSSPTRGSTSTSSTTNNSSTTTNTYNTGSNGGGSGGGGGGSTGTDQTGLINAYASIYNGQTENQLLGLGIGQPNCLVTAVLLGEQKVCTWTEGNASVIVTMLNGSVVSKTKLGF